jgi:hypothetical protein
MAKPVVTVKCIGCRNIRDIGLGDVPKGDQPICEHCGMPMVPVQVRGNANARRNTRRRR